MSTNHSIIIRNIYRHTKGTLRNPPKKKNYEKKKRLKHRLALSFVFVCEFKSIFLLENIFFPFVSNKVETIFLGLLAILSKRPLPRRMNLQNCRFSIIQKKHKIELAYKNKKEK